MKVEEGHVQEKEKLQTDLESAEKKLLDTGQSFKSVFLDTWISYYAFSAYIIIENCVPVISWLPQPSIFVAHGM